MLIRKLAILAGVCLLVLVAARIGSASQAATPAVEIADQAIQGGIVVVSKVIAAQPGWIVIHNGDQAGGFPAIGQAYIPAGETDNVAVLVDMDKATADMSAMLHIDAGEAGKYEFPGPDSPVQNGDKVVNTPFKAIGVSVDDQFVSDSQSVKISRVIAQQDGFIVIHSSANGFPAIGNAPIKAGVNTDVTVPIDAKKASPLLTAMIHIDAGQQGKYEFPGADVPATLGGAITNEPFWTSDHVRVRAQVVGGDSTLVVPSVLARQDGWIVVHSSAAGNPGIGVASVKAGLNKNVAVKIDDPKKLTDLVTVMLHVDAGQKAKYEFPGPDAPVKDSAGNVIAPLTLTKNGVVVHDIKADDIRKSSSVMVDLVLAAQNGWLVIHSSAPGNPAIGYTFVHAGYNPRVVVKVPPDAVTDTLTAMLHVDAGTPGKYEFPGADTPVNDNLGRVIAPKIVTAKTAPTKVPAAPTPRPPTRVPPRPGPVATQRR
jgi:hypothetical protein